MNKLIKRRTAAAGGKVSACLFITVFGILLLSPALGGTLKEYKEKISHLRADFEKMVSGKDGGTAGEREKFRSEVFEEVSEFLPARETIETGGVPVESDNRWIAEQIEEYQNGNSDETNRIIILNAIYERLAAIEAKIGELESAAAENATKDENKKKLAGILSREEFQKPKGSKEESFIQRIGRWIDEWLKKLFPPQSKLPKPKPPGLGVLGYILQIVVYALVAVLVGFLIYRFGPFLLRKFRHREKKKGSGRVVLGEKISAGESTATLFREAEDLARDGNLRAAIRKGYIALLFELGEQKMIGLAGHKTNRDYLRDVRKRGDLFRQLSGLTSNYERHWYGYKSVAAADWEEFRGGYLKLIRSRRP